MKDVVVGIVAIVVGALFCFRGYLAMRVIIPVWGGFIGFMVGAGIVASAQDDGLLRTALGWLVGLAVAIVFAACAYLYYELSVALAMAAMGFVLATALLVAIGVTWSWVLGLVGVLAGLVVAALVLATDVPAILLVVLTALAGATTIVGGAMLVVGDVDLSELDRSIGDRWDAEPWWYLLEVILVVAGVLAQARDAARRERVQEAWEQSPGRARA